MNALDLLSLNARSLKNKSSIFVDYVCDVRPELVAVTETWFNDKDTAARIDCSPPGYRLLDCHRTDSRGGGVELLSSIRKIFQLRKYLQQY